MLYRLTRLLMTAALRLFYRRVFTTGVESIPARGPVILLANHHASLMDAAFLGVLLNRPIHYFTRGDIFKNKFAVRIMQALNMIPVFDHTGKDTIGDNEPSFTQAREILLAGGVILFFPEGNSHVERKLFLLKKGAFRLAFQTFASPSNKDELMLVPVGINYAHPSQPETDVLVHLGTPLLISDYFEAYEKNAAAALLQVKKDVEGALLRNVLHVEKDSRQKLTDICLEINRNEDDFITPHWMQATRGRLEQEKRICARINDMQEEEAATFNRLAYTYHHQLQQLKISDALFKDLPQKKVNHDFMVKATFPLFLIGWLLNALPVLLAKRLADVKVKRTDFYSWIFVTGSALLYCMWILVLFLGFVFIDVKVAIVIIVITMILGPYTIFFLNHLHTFNQRRKLNRLKKEIPEVLDKLKIQRTIIKQKIINS